MNLPGDIDNKNVNSQFLSLVVMLASACWQQMGKVPNPVSGKIEKELSHAQITLELLVMIKEKTKGNLTKDEDQLICNTIADLQLNYSDEINKNQDTTPKN